MEILNQKNINNIDPNEDDINFKAIFRFFKRSKNLILGIVFTSSFITSIYAFNAKPKWSGSFNIVGCGSVSKINNRRLDTGAIRIKDGETLVLTGVIQETDIDTTYKYPIFGDLPLIGGLFRSKQSSKDKRELIILVTPKVLDDRTSKIADFNLEYKNEASINVIKDIK